MKLWDDEIEQKTNRVSKWILVVWISYFIVSISIISLLVYVVIHFLKKFW